MSNAGPGPNTQLNLVLSIVAPVIAVIAVLVLYFTKPVPVTTAAPAAVNTTTAKLPDPGVQLATALPGAGSAGNAGGGAAGGPPAGAGGPMGMPGAPGGMGGRLGGGKPGFSTGK